MIPGYALLCLTPALMAVEIGRWPSRRQAGATLVLGLALLIQFGLTVFNPMPGLLAQFRPTAEMRLAGDRLIEEIASTQGEVLVMLHPIGINLSENGIEISHKELIAPGRFATFVDASAAG